MSEIIYEVIPRSGMGNLSFGEDISKLVGQLGDPEDIENLSDEDEFPTTVLHYWDKRITVFVEGLEKQVISCFEIENEKTTLFGKWVFNMGKEEIISLMEEHGYKDLETETEEWGEDRISFEDALIDFYFGKDGKLISINWGVLVNDKGEIEDI